mmetsp:Transcript_254/g.632  ORF Transcript_254/g.632 Transcript_254/m.632 type:complete len:89 (-) Transcript_254:2049-2315(-)
MRKETPSSPSSSSDWLKEVRKVLRGGTGRGADCFIVDTRPTQHLWFSVRSRRLPLQSNELEKRLKRTSPIGLVGEQEHCIYDYAEDGS